MRKMTRKVALDSVPAAGLLRPLGWARALASHPYLLPSAQLPRGVGLWGSRSLPGGVSGEATGPQARSQHLNTLSSNYSWELGSHRHLRLQISLVTPSGRGYELL